MENFALTILLKSAQEMGIYNPFSKTSRWQSEKARFALPVNRPVDRPTVIFLTVVPPVDPPVDRAKPSVDRPVDRPAPESWVLLVGRPAFYGWPL